ncbi:hypothetical protein OIV83_005680 [Microbotryomycetes sp. JL201]|nr:hypothetical protein OIV83_005680 [Microbotryomycetes sp. JL201]
MAAAAEAPRKRIKRVTSVPVSAYITSAPGVVSALRPVRRALPILGEELELLRRLVYKNKNQHRNSHWWRKVIEMDRVTFKLYGELQQWIDLFGQASGKDDTVAIYASMITDALERASRPIQLLNKTIQLSLDTAYVLEQILDLKAFMAFTITITALVARLFTLCSALKADMQKVVLVLWRVTDAQKLHISAGLPSIVTELRGPTVEDTSAQTSANTSQPVIKAMTTEDTGAVVPRDNMALQIRHKQLTNGQTMSTDQPTAARERPKAPGIASATHSLPTCTKASRPGSRPGPVSVSENKRLAKLKKPKKPAGPRDEIDDIFG